MSDLGDNCGGDGMELAFGALEKEGKEEEEELRKLLGPGKAATMWIVCTPASPGLQYCPGNCEPRAQLSA